MIAMLRAASAIDLFLSAMQRGVSATAVISGEYAVSAGRAACAGKDKAPLVVGSWQFTVGSFQFAINSLQLTVFSLTAC